MNKIEKYKYKKEMEKWGWRNKNRSKILNLIKSYKIREKTKNSFQKKEVESPAWCVRCDRTQLKEGMLHAWRKQVVVSCTWPRNCFLVGMDDKQSDGEEGEGEGGGGAEERWGTFSLHDNFLGSFINATIFFGSGQLASVCFFSSFFVGLIFFCSFFLAWIVLAFPNL